MKHYRVNKVTRPGGLVLKRKDILADVSSRVAGINTNIQTLEATTDDQRGSIRMTVEINDLKHLERVIKSLRSVNGVLDVERAGGRQKSEV